MSNKIPIHYLPAALALLLTRSDKHDLAKCYQIAGGWIMVVDCKQSGMTYKLHIEPILSEKTVVPSSIEELLERGKI